MNGAWTELHRAERRRRDNIEDVLFCLFLFVAGILFGWRLHYLANDYPVSNSDKIEISKPHCTEDEWLSPETFECVHIDTILEDINEKAVKEFLESRT